MTFLTPLGALVALAVVVPLVAFFFAERGRRHVAAVLALTDIQGLSRRAAVISLLSIAALLGLAATQPTLVHKSAHKVREDAAAFFVIDTSRSMLASNGPTAPTRFERASKLAVEVRDKLPDIRVGLASMTDRVLPHLFPSSDRQSFDLTLREVVGVERPPPSDGFNTVITTLGALTHVASDNFFPFGARRRLVVVFTDGESNRFVDSSVGALFKRPPVTRTIFVHLWGPNEHVYDAKGRPEPAYRLDSTSTEGIKRLALATNGIALEGENADDTADAARSLLGSGPKVDDVRERRRLDLAPFLTLGIFAPLGFLLYRRNL